MKKTNTAIDSSDSKIKQAVKKINKHELDYLLSKKTLVTPNKLKELVEDLGGTYIKLAQFLSYRPDIVPSKYRFEIDKQVSVNEQDLKLIEFIAKKQGINNIPRIKNEFRKYLELENNLGEKLSDNILTNLKNNYVNPTGKPGLNVKLSSGDVKNLNKIINYTKNRDTERLTKLLSKHFHIKDKKKLYSFISPYTSSKIEPNLQRIAEQTAKVLRGEGTVLTMEEAFQLRTLMNISLNNETMINHREEHLFHFLLSGFSFLLAFVLIYLETNIVLIFISLLLATWNLIYSFKH